MTPDQQPVLADLTPARVALGRAGGSLPTAARLRLRADHAAARDAVRHGFDPERVAADVRAAGVSCRVVRSATTDRDDYVRRPDLGRVLSAVSRSSLSEVPVDPVDLVIVVCDGLSPGAVQRSAPGLVRAIVEHPLLVDWTSGDVVVVEGGRVAIGDEIGAALGATFVAVLIGERPGLSVPESLGVYVTLNPEVGRTDAERNCISNIHPDGLTVEVAADRFARLLVRARAVGATGVALGGSERDGAHGGRGVLGS